MQLEGFTMGLRLFFFPRLFLLNFSTGAQVEDVLKLCRVLRSLGPTVGVLGMGLGFVGWVLCGDFLAISSF